MKTGIDFIAAERNRQMSKHGFSPEHDNKHTNKELIRNAIDVLQSYLNTIFSPCPAADRWGLGRKHHEEPGKLLDIAGALIAAERDRLTRTEPPRNHIWGVVWGCEHHANHDFIEATTRQNAEVKALELFPSVLEVEEYRDDEIQAFREKHGDILKIVTAPRK